MVLDQVIAVHKISPLSQFDEKQWNFSFTNIILDSRLIKSPYHSLPNDEISKMNFELL